MVITKQIPMGDTQKIKNCKHNTTENHQLTKEDSKRRMKQMNNKRARKQQNSKKNIYINNYFK